MPLLVRWPGKIPAGSVSNEIVQHHDWLPTFLAMADEPNIVEKLKKGYKAIGRTYRNHRDGYNFLPYLTGQGKEGPRKVFFYFSDDGDVLGCRYDNWKLVFMEQRTPGTLAVWADPFTPLRMPKIFNLRTDPYEFASVTSNTCYDWFLHNAHFLYAAQAAAGSSRRPSGTSRRCRSRTRSRSTRRWRRCRKPAAGGAEGGNSDPGGERIAAWRSPDGRDMFPSGVAG